MIRRGYKTSESLKLKRTGLFGGTFNPIHWGHLKTVQEVKNAFNLSQVLLIPAALPPHKASKAVANAEDRIHMIRLALAGDSELMEAFTVSDVELTRSGPSYTIDTVRHFKRILSNEIELYFIMGLDAFFEIDTWKSYRTLFRLVPFVVMIRPDGSGQDYGLMLKRLEDYLKERISDNYRYSESQAGYTHEENPTIFVCRVKPIDISSTQIRECIRKGLSITALVPENVEDFIKTKGLYL